MSEIYPPEWFDPLPDIPGCRKRWRRWTSSYVEGLGRVTVEEIYGEAYIVPEQIVIYETNF